MSLPPSCKTWSVIIYVSVTHIYDLQNGVRIHDIDLVNLVTSVRLTRIIFVGVFVFFFALSNAATHSVQV